MYLICLYFVFVYIALVKKNDNSGCWIQNISIPHLIRVDYKDCFAVHLLDLFWCDQVGHAHRFPARFSLPQDRMHSGQQSTDVTLLPLNPVQNLHHKQESKKRKNKKNNI